MSTLHQLPFGAETPDDFLVPYVNGTLTPPEREEVERWLAVHPEWAGRLAAYGAIGGAVRQAAAASAPPAIGSMAALWENIATQPQPRPFRPLPPPPPPGAVSGPQAAPERRRGRGPAGWLVAVAAALLVALAAASVVLAVNRDDNSQLSERATTTAAAESGGAAGEDDEPSAAPPPAPGAAPATVQTLRDGAVATADQKTAHTDLHAVGVVDFRGTTLADLSGTDEVTVTIDGQGQIEFPDRSRLDTTTTLDGGIFSGDPGDEASTVEIGDRVWVSCAGGEYVEQVAGTDEECTGLGFGTAFFGPEAAIDILENADGEVTEVGAEDVDGIPTTRYSLEMDIAPDDTRPDDEVPVTIDVWIGVDDGLIHQVSATTEFTLPIDLLGETHELPTTLEMTYHLADFGAAVDIPDLG